MTNATHTIIGLFGGVSHLARAIKRRPSTVQYWADTGRIPAKNREDVLSALRAIAPEVVERAIEGEGAPA